MRRRRGTGGLFKRKADGLWVAQVSHGPRGHRTVRRKYAQSKAEAKRLLDELRGEFAVAGSSTTTGEYLRSWLRANERLRPSTRRTYTSMIERHLVPTIGAVRLGALAPDHVERMLAKLPLAPKGRRNVLSLLARVLAVAERRGLVGRNAAHLVDAPRVVMAERSALSVTDAKRILAAVHGDRLEALYVLALTTGLRMGELLGLAWSDWNRETATLEVRHALVRVGGKYRLDEPKTRSSVRAITLPAFAATALEEHRRRQLEERIAAGSPTADGLIFVSPAGRPISAGWLSHHWRKVADPLGLDLRFHDLRHGQASLLVALGVHPRVAAERLGHATIRQTMERYAHVDLALDREAAGKLDEALA
jgi:integrase